MGAAEHLETIKDKVSKGQCLSRKKMHFCIHHKRFYCKHMCRTCINEVGFKVVIESSSHDHDAILEQRKIGLPNHAKERARAMLESNDSTTPKPLHNKIRVEEMNSSAATRKLVKSHLLILRKKRNNEAKLLKNTVTGISKWTYRNFDSNDVEDSEDRSNLIAREIIKSNSEVMILIVAKSMLKLLQNESTKLSSDATHGTAWNHQLLHARGKIDNHHHFHPIAHVFSSSETTTARTFLLENILQLRKRIFGGDSPDVDFTINNNSNAMFDAVEKVLPDTFHVKCFANLARVGIPKHNKCLHSGVSVDDVTQDFVEIGKLWHELDCQETVMLCKEKCEIQKDFSKELKTECVEPRNLFWCSGLLLPGIDRSNDGCSPILNILKQRNAPK